MTLKGLLYFSKSLKYKSKVEFPFITVSSPFKQYTHKCSYKNTTDMLKKAHLKSPASSKTQSTMCPAWKYGNANSHKRKHLPASQLLHKGFDKRVDKVAGDDKGY